MYLTSIIQALLVSSAYAATIFKAQSPSSTLPVKSAHGGSYEFLLKKVSYADYSYSVPYVGSILPTFQPTKKPTRMPTKKPTANPTTKPTTLPSVAPSRIPSFIPSVSPTNKPTFTPTTIPTVSPSFIPTGNPTNIPTSIPTKNPTPNPTLNPTLVPILVPTPLPTPSLPIVQFSAGIQLNNAPPTLSPSAQDALIVATAVAMSIPTSSVTYGGLTPVVLKKMEVASALRSEPMIRIDATGISVVANMLGKVVIPLGTSASTYQDTLKNSLQASISSGSFVNNLKGSPLSNSTATFTGFTSTVTYTSPTSPPTRQPTTIRSYGGAIAGLVIMCVVVTGIVAGLIYYFFVRSRGHSQTAEPVPSKPIYQKPDDIPAPSSSSTPQERELELNLELVSTGGASSGTSRLGADAGYVPVPAQTRESGDYGSHLAVVPTDGGDSRGNTRI